MQFIQHPLPPCLLNSHSAASQVTRTMITVSAVSQIIPRTSTPRRYCLGLSHINLYSWSKGTRAFSLVKVIRWVLHSFCMEKKKSSKDTKPTFGQWDKPCIQHMFFFEFQVKAYWQKDNKQWIINTTVSLPFSCPTFRPTKIIMKMMMMKVALNIYLNIYFVPPLNWVLSKHLSYTTALWVHTWGPRED